MWKMWIMWKISYHKKTVCGIKPFQSELCQNYVNKKIKDLFGNFPQTGLWIMWITNFLRVHFR